MVDRTNLPFVNERAPVEAAVSFGEQQTPFEMPKKVRAPEGAPNVLVVLIDDMGFGASSAFGGPCEMPVAEELAQNGLRYSRFHTAAICSPTRAALLSGRNHHSVGMGNVTNFATASPGYDMSRPPTKGTLAQTLKLNGYATGAFGKWHQVPEWESSDAGPFDRWPTGEGFDKFYGYLGGESSQFTPSLVEGTTRIGPPPGAGEEGYHFSEDLVDQTMSWIRGIRTFDRSKPWFGYLSFGATHAPFQVPDSWKDRYRGKFGHGWDEQRKITLEKQKQLGVIPEDAELAPWVGDVPEWDNLTDTEKLAAERLMEIYASFAEHTDAQVGRLIEFLRDQGELDNTIVLYILGDNGASAEGGFTGTLNELLTLNGFEESAERIVEHLDEIGGPTTYAHYPVGWALAMNTPYQWTKQVASHYGGTRNGMIVHWPAGITAKNEIRNQWHHVIDVAPTVLEAAGLPQPETINGVQQEPIEGTSFLYSFNEGKAKDRHITQYFEIFGNRGIYHEGWTAVTPHRVPWRIASGTPLKSLDDDVWELYDTRSDWTQARDLAAEHPERLQELQELFLAEARKYNVLPIDDRGYRPANSPGGAPRIDTFTSIILTPGDKYLIEKVLPNVKNSSFTVTVDLEADSDTSDGVLIAQGGRFGGWTVHVEDGHPVFDYNLSGLECTTVRSKTRLPAGKHTVTLEFDYDGGGIAKGGTATLHINGEPVGSGRLERTVPFVFGANETTNVGRDAGSTVTDYRRAGANPYTGTVKTATITVGTDKVQPPVEQQVQAELVTH